MIKDLKNQPFVTYIIVAINIIVFLMMTVAGGSSNTQVLLAFGAKYTPFIQQGDWWRLFTPMFIHIGLMHLVVNMVTVFYLGKIVESLFGHWRFTIVYLVSGVVGNIASFVLLPANISAGASTSIFGLFGAFMMLGESFKDNPYIRLMARQFLTFIVINLVFDIFLSGVDIYGHIGGLIGGFLIAYVVGAPKLGKNDLIKRFLSGIILCIAIALFLQIGMRGF